MGLQDETKRIFWMFEVNSRTRKMRVLVAFYMTSETKYGINRNFRAPLSYRNSIQMKNVCWLEKSHELRSSLRVLGIVPLSVLCIVPGVRYQ